MSTRICCDCGESYLHNPETGRRCRACYRERRKLVDARYLANHANPRKKAYKPVSDADEIAFIPSVLYCACCGARITHGRFCDIVCEHNWTVAGCRKPLPASVGVFHHSERRRG